MDKAVTFETVVAAIEQLIQNENKELSIKNIQEITGGDIDLVENYTLKYVHNFVMVWKFARTVETIGQGVMLLKPNLQEEVFALLRSALPAQESKYIINVIYGININPYGSSFFIERAARNLCLDILLGKLEVMLGDIRGE